jgi:hypothetical protein
LKKQYGGECNPLLTNEQLKELEPISQELYEDISPDNRITINGRCWKLKSAVDWIMTKLNGNLPVTDPFRNGNWTNDDIDRVITEYNRVFNENIIINNANDLGQHLIIPDYFNEVNRYEYYDQNISSVVIHDNVTSIGAGAFELNFLETVIIPDSVTSIGSDAFASYRIRY